MISWNSPLKINAFVNLEKLSCDHPATILRWSGVEVTTHTYTYRTGIGSDQSIAQKNIQQTLNTCISTLQTSFTHFFRIGGQHISLSRFSFSKRVYCTGILPVAQYGGGMKWFRDPLVTLLPSCFPSHFPCPCSSGSSCKQWRNEMFIKHHQRIPVPSPLSFYPVLRSCKDPVRFL
jgi:hypothetical protein